MPDMIDRSEVIEQTMSALENGDAYVERIGLDGWQVAFPDGSTLKFDTGDGTIRDYLEDKT